MTETAKADIGDEAKSSVPEIEINGQPYKAEFTWASYSEARTKLGEDPDMMNPAILSQYAVFALRRHHPMITADQIMEASPPMVPVAKAIRVAQNRLFWGDTPPSA